MTGKALRPPGQRRRYLFGAVAAGAVASGAALAWWQRSSAPAPLPLWDLQFDTLQRQKLAMSQFSGKPLVLNFWATWCAPCIEELPLLDNFFRQNSSKGWQVLGLAVDQAAAVELFLRRNPVSFSIALAGLPGIELSRSLGNISGGLPFTVALGTNGQVIQRKMGKLTAQDLQTWAALR